MSPVTRGFHGRGRTLPPQQDRGTAGSAHDQYRRYKPDTCT
jgi:hypothetical protein